MPLLPAKCPECGGLIEVTSEKKAGLCQYCGQPFVVEDAVNNFNQYFNITYNHNTVNNYSDGTIVNVFENDSKDFEVEGGVLKKYHGADVDVVIPNNVVKIGNYAFSYLKIKNVVIPDSVTSIGDSAFRGCDSLKDITIPDSVTTIGAEAFYGCASLTRITIPDSVMKIVSNTVSSSFDGCVNLESVIVSENFKMFGAFKDLKKVVFKNTDGTVSRAGRRYQHKCQHCGGEFNYPLFGRPKCTICHTPKDY